MATQAHCLYCFETLAASLEKRDALTLAQVEKFWDAYSESLKDAASASHEGADSDVAEVDGDVSMDEDEDEEDADEIDSEDELSKSQKTPTSSAPGDSLSALKPAGVSRLKAKLTSPSSLSGSSASPSSTASSTSTRSSSRLFDQTSKASSRTSFFSLGRGSSSSSSRPRLPDSPLFVTWNILSKSGGKSLRGCIGTFEDQELSYGLKSYALTSAFDDSRFMPISKKELPTLEVGVTLLTNFETAPSEMAWDIGTHGLRISFTYHGRRHGATYLPDVALEQGWTKEETLVSLMRKAGWSGRRDEWRKVVDLKVIRYQGKRCSLPYVDWREWRDWVEEQHHL
ncbi:hypothetical protein L228DRAFT_225357 [Xylona heveae TC161]|uniref:AMMECR1 domain-containing protein n=1 Tax=Xylona heveae (strain CBS 132557 / TC161) TaxID=1328760 RepID=A0A164ZA30_XYLHT|nr:hypothetical protein L228DRAFT_225357 [Xylona heveae TC161]KZF18860.1 hypothetical protein L228DRAFT_225357 [Xylona heveae TC161]